MAPEASSSDQIPKPQTAEKSVETKIEELQTHKNSMRDTAGSNSQSVPAGYKLVKVRRADGTIATVKRKVTSEEAATTPPECLIKPASLEQSSLTQPEFKIVAVRQPDGSLVKVRRRIKQDDRVHTTTQSSAQGSEKWDAPTSFVNPDTGKEISDKEAGATDPILKDALAQQVEYNRQRRSHRFKTSMLKAFATILGSSIPALEVTEFFDGDEILSGDDFSDDEGLDGYHDMANSADHDHDDDHDDTMIDEDIDHHQDRNSNSHDVDSKEATFDAGKALGGIAAATAANATSRPAPPPPTFQPETGKNNTNENNTYKVTKKHLNDMENKIGEGETTRPLRRHWANFTFYFMASLSIILPLCFLLLGLFIFLMNGKSLQSNWGKLIQAIKVAISAWPIVFAAVVAQGFKAWATYKVERGIKLMELEQLIGSNSFGSAIKQPLVLRRIDLLTLLLFIIWCLSPIGSQSLQRCYTKEFSEETKNTTVYYLDITEQNPFASKDGINQIYKDNAPSEAWNRVAAAMQSVFLPPDVSDNPLEDDWYHPRTVPLPQDRLDGGPFTTSQFGIPVVMTDSIFGEPRTGWNPDYAKALNPSNITSARHEITRLTISTSYFRFNCGNWTTTDYATMWRGLDPNVTWVDGYYEGAWASSNSETLWMGLNQSTADGPFDILRLASRDKMGNWTNQEKYDYSIIQCSFSQVFVDMPLVCYRHTDEDIGVAHCIWANSSTKDTVLTPSQNIKNPQGANLTFNFSDDFVKYTNGVSEPDATTPIFAERMAYLFNTWLDLGHSYTHIDDNKFSDINSTHDRHGHWINTTGSRTFTSDQVFKLDIAWTVVYCVCAAILLIVGIIAVIVESMTVAPDVLGYVSTVARNSKYLHLPKTNSAMSGGERARVLGSTKVMMQDVKAKADIGRIALGLKHEQAQRLQPGRLYR